MIAVVAIVGMGAFGLGALVGYGFGYEAAARRTCAVLEGLRRHVRGKP